MTRGVRKLKEKLIKIKKCEGCGHINVIIDITEINRIIKEKYPDD